MTKLCLDVIGDPIGHSKSPYIHETVLQELNIPYEYRKVKVQKGQLDSYLDEVTVLGISGFNLTMPHKVDVLPYLDFIDDDAKFFNSVNTVKVKDGKLLGYNTDGQGMLIAMKEKGFEPLGQNIAILGAGGVASTISVKMALEGAEKITIFNRTPAAAEAISQNVLKSTGKTISTAKLDCNILASSLTEYNILINCTPLGMQGTDCEFEDLSFLEALKSGALVYDLIYNPVETTLLKSAKSLGFNTLNGFGMLIYQGLLADEIFLERPLNFLYFKEKIEYKLKNLKNF